MSRPRRWHATSIWAWIVGALCALAAAETAWTAAGAPSAARPGWRLVFADEFDGEALDLTKWNPRDPWGAERNNELQAYVEDAFFVEDGVLHIVAEQRPAFYDGEARQYTSGMMTTYRKFSQQYGLFEIRAKVPTGRGLWPAFWLLPVPLGWPPEIDVLEILGHDTRRVYMTHHWRDASGAHRSHGGSYVGDDFAADFHTFAVEWSPEKIVWYVDGAPRFVSTRSIPHTPMYMLVNLAVGGDWPGSPDASTPFPSTFDIDYVRVYTRLGLHIDSPRAGETVRGTVGVEFSVLAPDDATLSRVEVALDGTPLFRGTAPPPSLPLDTLQYPDGPHTLSLTAALTNGHSASREVRFVVDNWWQLDDPFLEPLDAGWFGILDRKKTSSESPGWAYATDRAEEFFGDANRRVRTSDAAAHLVWEAPNLRAFRLTLYIDRTSDAVPDPASSVSLEVSADGAVWRRVPFTARPGRRSSSGWSEVLIEGEVPAGWAPRWFRLGVSARIPAEAVQLGHVFLQGLHEAPHGDAWER